VADRHVGVVAGMPSARVAGRPHQDGGEGRGPREAAGGDGPRPAVGALGRAAGGGGRPGGPCCWRRPPLAVPCADRRGVHHRGRRGAGVGGVGGEAGREPLRPCPSGRALASLPSRGVTTTEARRPRWRSRTCRRACRPQSGRTEGGAACRCTCPKAAACCGSGTRREGAARAEGAVLPLPCLPRASASGRRDVQRRRRRRRACQRVGGRAGGEGGRPLCFPAREAGRPRRPHPTPRASLREGRGGSANGIATRGWGRSATLLVATSAPCARRPATAGRTNSRAPRPPRASRAADGGPVTPVGVPVGARGVLAAAPDRPASDRPAPAAAGQPLPSPSRASAIAVAFSFDSRTA